MSTASFNLALEKLSQASLVNFMDPGTLEWPDNVDPDCWYFTPEIISLYGTYIWGTMDNTRRHKLSFYETINFFSLNIHGEKYLISEISRQLFTQDQPELHRYLLHLVEEETKHMMYFSNFCTRYAGFVYSDRTLKLDSSDDPKVQTLLLFARIYLFEEIVDEYNSIMARDGRLAGIVRQINHIHHVEEARHLAFGRKFLVETLEQLAGYINQDQISVIRNHLQGYLYMVWAQYYNPDVYADAGLENPFDTRSAAIDAPVCQAHRRRFEDKRLGLLRQLDLLET